MEQDYIRIKLLNRFHGMLNRSKVSEVVREWYATGAVSKSWAFQSYYNTIVSLGFTGDRDQHITRIDEQKKWSPENVQLVTPKKVY